MCPLVRLKPGVVHTHSTGVSSFLSVSICRFAGGEMDGQRFSCKRDRQSLPRGADHECRPRRTVRAGCELAAGANRVSPSGPQPSANSGCGLPPFFGPLCTARARTGHARPGHIRFPLRIQCGRDDYGGQDGLANYRHLSIGRGTGAV